MLPTIPVLKVEPLTPSGPWQWKYQGNAIEAFCVMEDDRPLTLIGIWEPPLLGARLVDEAGVVHHITFVHESVLASMWR